MKNVYIYVENNKVDFILKYGMKLSEHADKVFIIKDVEKKGIAAYLSPKDSVFYSNENYTCLRVLVDDLNIFVYNKICEKNEFLKDFTCDIKKYNVGDYEDPVAFICSSILPEHIFLYNKIMDIPIFVESSREYYYEKFITEMLDNNYFSNYELYQLLLILGEQKKCFSTYKKNDGLKILKDKKSGKKYIKKSIN